MKGERHERQVDHAGSLRRRGHGAESALGADQCPVGAVGLYLAALDYDGRVFGGPPLLIAAVFIWVSILITKSGENKEAGYGHETLHWVGSTLLLCLGAAVSWGMLQFGLLGLAFSHEPEHVVQRGGQKMVAVVNSFLVVYVDYHAYRNAFYHG